MWVVTLSDEASAYLYDSFPYVASVIEGLEALARTVEGIPPKGCTQIEPGVYLWEAADHLIVYTKILGERPRLRILIVKPRG